MLNSLAYFFGYYSGFHSNNKINRINIGNFIHFNQNKAYPAFNCKTASAEPGCSTPGSNGNAMVISQLNYPAYLLSILNFYHSVRQVFKPCRIITISQS